MEQNSKVNRDEEARKLFNTLSELELQTRIEENIKDNKIYFDHKETKYRIKKPLPKEQLEIEKYRREKYNEFINDENMFFREQWIEKYKVKGIDIEKMDGKMDNLKEEIKRVQIRLAQTTNAEGIKSLKKNIENLKYKLVKLHIRKQDLLSYSIEEQLIVEVTSYTSYIVLEKKIKDDKYEKMFKNYDEFLSYEDDGLLNKAFFYVTQYLNSGDISL